MRICGNYYAIISIMLLLIWDFFLKLKIEKIEEVDKPEPLR